MIDITVKKTFSASNIDDIICTALEGGINYWAISAKPKNGDYKGADYASDCISKGGTIMVKTDDGKLHELNLETLKKGIELYAEKEGSDFLDDLDSSGADCIIQYALFGEIVYG